MQWSRDMNMRSRLSRLAVSAALALAGALPAHAQDAAALNARHAALRDALADNAFARPLVLESSERADGLQGDIHARIDQPFSVVGAALQGVGRWCDILILHLNVKQCRGVDAKPAEVLQLAIGQKHDHALDQAYRFAFAYEVVTSRPDYLQVQLSADEGPLGTSRYRIVLEVAALDARRSIVRMSYAYSFGLAARVAMQGYLATAGRDKVGFSVVGRQPDGAPTYIGGTRGIIERNTMRYYLAIESYLGALSLPPAQQFEQRLASWHRGVESYPRQLRELGRNEYVAMKREQLKRQQATAGG
jgi:hypothetical protein